MKLVTRSELILTIYPNNNKRKIHKEEAHSPSSLRRALCPGRGVLALAAAMLACVARVRVRVRVRVRIRVS